MGLPEIVYIPVIALVNLGVLCAWGLLVRKKSWSKGVWAWAFVGSLLTTWGLDVLLRGLEAESYYDSVEISAGAWLVFVLATHLKYSLPKRTFWADYGGDLVGFILSGMLVYAVALGRMYGH